MRGEYVKRRIEKQKRYREDELDWELSFEWIPERERTKHVHRLHPYKGKFIPQLVEYFLKKRFRKGDVILDPFNGSGTALIQANELGIHSIGVDISEFNTIIAEVKFAEVNLAELERETNGILESLKTYEEKNDILAFEKELKKELDEFNKINFPSPRFKKEFREGKVPKEYLLEKRNEFLKSYESLLDRYGLSPNREKGDSFLDKWYLQNVREEARRISRIVQNVEDERVKKTLMVILSRTLRSVRATTHMDLDRLKAPQYTPYYCYKHSKICKPVFSLIPTFKKYAKDTVKRLAEYKNLKTRAFQEVLTGDSRTIDIFEEVKKKNEDFHRLLKDRKITGMFTSPPYLGQIDYHEQHAYAYELFGIERRDELEIGPLYKGKGREARKSYVEGVARVLKNSLEYMVENPTIIIVANDKYDLYPEIAERAGLKIVEKYERPVSNRTSRDRNAYWESVFVLERDMGESTTSP